MRALLLAAGFGTRLRPLTDNVPKCLVPINGRPLLDIWLQRLTQANVSTFLINTHYLSEKVEAYLSTSAYASRVRVMYEPLLLGTAGTLIENLAFFAGEDGLLIHADNYCLADFDAFISAHRKRPPECLMTMMTFQTFNPASCGIVELDARGVVTRFHEKVVKPPGNLANGAVYILSAQLQTMLANELHDASDFSTEVIHRLIGRIFTYETDQAFVDIGTPEAYQTVCDHFCR